MGECQHTATAADIRGKASRNPLDCSMQKKTARVKIKKRKKGVAGVKPIFKAVTRFCPRIELAGRFKNLNRALDTFEPFKRQRALKKERFLGGTWVENAFLDEGSQSHV